MNTDKFVSINVLIVYLSMYMSPLIITESDFNTIILKRYIYFNTSNFTHTNLIINVFLKMLQSYPSNVKLREDKC